MRLGIIIPLLLFSLAATSLGGGRLTPAEVSPESGGMLITSENSASLLSGGRTNLLRFRMSDAEDVFRELSSKPDGEAAAWYHLGLASMLKLLMTDRQPYYEEFYGRSDTLAGILDSLPDSRWKLFLDAESKLHRALVRAKDGSYLRAAFAGRGAYRTYSRLVAEYPDFYDAYKGLGLLRIAVGSMPSFYRTFLSVLGIHGTIREGLRNLNAAADSSLYGREESVILLRLYDILLGTDHGTGGRLESLYRTYPDSPFLAHLYGFSLYSERRAAAAEEVLRPASGKFGEPDYFFVDYVDFFLADALFRQDRFQESVFYYQRYLDNHEGAALKATASLKMGQALEMIGHRLAARSFYADVKATREFDSDQVARRTAERLLAAPMSETDRSLLRGRNAFDSRRHETALAILRPILVDLTVGVDRRAEAAYRVGRTYHEMDRQDEALSAYREAVVLTQNPELRWAPWSEYHAGRIFEARGDTAAAQAAYLRAAAYRGDFDYHQALEKNVKVSLDRLSDASS